MSKKNKPGQTIWHLAIIAAIIVTLFLGVKATLKRLYPLKYKDEIIVAAQKHNIDPIVLFALVEAESSFNAEAVSHAGAVGLTQITEETFDWIKWKMNDTREITFADIKKPEVALDYGAFLLAQHIGEFGALDNALCAYNAGRTTTKRWLLDDNYSQEINNVRAVNNIPYKETANYVKKINRSIKIYTRLYNL